MQRRGPKVASGKVTSGMIGGVAISSVKQATRWSAAPRAIKSPFGIPREGLWRLSTVTRLLRQSLTALRGLQTAYVSVAVSTLNVSFSITVTNWEVSWLGVQSLQSFRQLRTTGKARCFSRGLQRLTHLPKISVWLCFRVIIVQVKIRKNLHLPLRKVVSPPMHSSEPDVKRSHSYG